MAERWQSNINQFELWFYQRYALSVSVDEYLEDERIVFYISVMIHEAPLGPFGQRNFQAQYTGRLTLLYNQRCYVKFAFEVFFLDYLTIDKQFLNMNMYWSISEWYCDLFPLFPEHPIFEDFPKVIWFKQLPYSHDHFFIRKSDEQRRFIKAMENRLHKFGLEAFYHFLLDGGGTLVFSRRTCVNENKILALMRHEKMFRGIAQIIYYML